MITASTITTAALLEQLADSFATVNHSASAMQEAQFNTPPPTGGWTVAQVIDHLTKSNRSIVKALKLQGTRINREPGARVNELREIFLDYNKKFEAPSFIVPAEQPLERSGTLSLYMRTGNDIIQAAEETETSEMINHPAFGDITKLEILHFVLYHTIRHQNQIDKIIKQIQ